MPAIMHGRDAWCLKKNKMGILHSTEKSTVIAMCGIQLKNIKKLRT